MASPGSTVETTRIPSATFEAVAVELGLMTPAQVDECRVIHRTLLDLGLTSTIAEVCLKKGVLDPAQVAAVENALGRRGDVLFPGYEIIGKIAEGGMGVVYKARQVSMDRLVAVKVLLPKLANDRAGRERFVREARAVAKLSHPNIVSGIDAGEVGGVYYFVMEYLDGEPMDQELRRRGPLPWREATTIVRQVALALDHADRHGIVHRDVKPGNIMLLKDGTVKLADLGLALATASDDAALTQAGMIIGSPAYLSPEQARGDSALDIRSDIFSLGLSFFEMMTAQRAYAGSSPISVLTELLTRDVGMERLAAHGVPAGVTTVLAKMLQRDPSQRYQTPRQLCADLDSVLEDREPANAGSASTADVAPLASPAPPLSNNLMRSRAARLGLASLFVVLLSLAAMWFAGRDQAGDTPVSRAVVPALPLGVTLNLVGAIERALKELPGGAVYHAEQELGRYSIDFAVGQRTYNIVVDGNNGGIVEKLEEDGDHSLDVQMSRMPLTTAVRTAERAVSGRAVEAGILLLPGRPVVEVKLIRDGVAVWVDVDGVTGQVSSERSSSLMPN